jgi:hypothetical protein
VLSLAGDPTAPGTLYAGTDSNVYRSADGKTWSQVAPGIPGKVAALVVRAGAARSAIVFAGSQNNILRYPAVAGSSGAGGLVLGALILLLLVGLLFYFTRRNMRILGRVASQTGPDGRPPGSEAPSGDATARDSHNGHDPTRLPTRP